MRDGRYMTP